ncbi:DNA recombination protein RmuC [bacterium]|nr:DNA recombination protein RmuC [bacterium]
MCFFYRRKILKQQEQLLEKMSKLENETDKSKDIITTTIQTNLASIFTGINSNNELVLTNVRDISANTEKRIGEIKEDLFKSLGDIRYNVDRNLTDVRADNEKRLNEIRTMVEEKLTNTLNERLNQTFVAINERLDAVNKGLGEMQSLSAGVTDLRKVLSNVKTRGIWGEVSLENLLDGILTKSQYISQQNVSGLKNGEAVDFAIVLPGSGENSVYLPIDVKFPLEDYQRLVESSEKGDIAALQSAVVSIEKAIKLQAKKIKEKYINPPITTDFAIMYLPIEGLYAEVIKNPGLIEELQSKYKIIPAGPTTISAILNSLQLGFRTLAIQKSSKEVFDLLMQFKKDFNKFVENIDKAQRQVDDASKTLDDATKRSSLIMKRLGKVDAIAMLEEEEGEGI